MNQKRQSIPVNKTIRALALVALVTASCQRTGQQHLSEVADHKGGARIEHPSGLTITIPPDGLYGDATVSVELVDAPADADAQTFILPEAVAYEISFSGDGAFKKPVEIAIPYEQSLLSDNRSEADIFPVAYFDGVWYRGDGKVDREASVVRAMTLHNGLWSWAVDLGENWIEGPQKAFFCLQQDDPETLAKARANAEEKRDELLWILDDAQLRVESAKAPYEDIDEWAEFVQRQIVSSGISFTYEVSALSALSEHMGGIQSLIYIGNQPVGAWRIALGKATPLTVYGAGLMIIFDQAEAIGNVAFQTRRIHLAYQRWKEAEAIVRGLEDGCMAVNMPPSDAKALQDYFAALEIAQTVSSPSNLTLDLTVSAYDDPMDLEAVVVPVESDGPADRSEQLDPTLLPDAASPIRTGPITYVVEEGDSLVTIADQFGVTIDQLIAANNLVDSNTIAVGSQLVIPTESPPSPAQPLPSVEITFPEEGVVYSSADGLVGFSVEWLPAGGAASYELIAEFSDGALYGGETVGAANCCHRYWELPAENWVIRVEAVDADGNVFSTDSVSFSVSQQSP